MTTESSAMERRMEGQRFIGIDGGGTKTVCILGEPDGTILAMSRGESSSVKSRPWEEVQRVLLTLIQDVLEKTGTPASQLGGVFLGLAGSDRPEDRQRVQDWLRTELPDEVAITVHNDAVTALIAGTWGQRGIALISGTGSIAYGFDPATDTFVRVGGWGYLLGDEGSGFDLGRQALLAVMRAYDGRGEATALTSLVLDRWSLERPEQLINTIYGQDNIRTAIADGSKLVVRAAAEGDSVAVGLVEEAVECLEALVRTAATRMGLPLTGDPLASHGVMTLVLSGGLFNDAWFLKQFLATPTMRTGAFDVQLLERPPVIGAYLLALQEHGLELTEAMKTRMEASITRLL
ncbi:N-acetylglucosamine kinase [Paenibacillus cremeus]|uniref:N-acetylglucosamine kinase n=1 Tax=Paenibacillus cremeus TaxID=2163881 RepID=A0A559KDG9_9BACL|nr:BadF/BadG/BcrA/BcrD ATPase family protein [Paenibacillus cremeus]TVY10181.1 N-acetylglucosamine kinase [Paenibacillus cremeus]